MPGKLRILHFHRQHIGTAIPDIFRRQLHAARQDIAVFAELAHRIQQALTQTVNMRTALHGWDQVYIAFGQQLAAFRQPEQRPVNGLCLTAKITDKRFFRQRRQAIHRFAQIIIQTILVAPALFAIIDLIFKGDLNARTQYRFSFQYMR